MHINKIENNLSRLCQMLVFLLILSLEPCNQKQSIGDFEGPIIDQSLHLLRVGNGPDFFIKYPRKVRPSRGIAPSEYTSSRRRHGLCLGCDSSGKNKVVAIAWPCLAPSQGAWQLTIQSTMHQFLVCCLCLTLRLQEYHELVEQPGRDTPQFWKTTLMFLASNYMLLEQSYKSVLLL